MDRQQLQKFAQYLISRHYNDVLPTAQHLADEVLRSDSEINAIHGNLVTKLLKIALIRSCLHAHVSIAGAPDPTAGPPDDDLDDHRWYLDDTRMRSFVRCYLVHTNSSTEQFRQLFAKVKNSVLAGLHLRNGYVDAYDQISCVTLDTVSNIHQ